MVELVLFDIDGTLIHTGGAGVKAFARTLASEFGVANGSEKMRFGGRTDPSLVQRVFRVPVRTGPSAGGMVRVAASMAGVADAAGDPGEWNGLVLSTGPSALVSRR